jgi:hypothetical protein
MQTPESELDPKCASVSPAKYESNRKLKMNLEQNNTEDDFQDLQSVLEDDEERLRLPNAGLTTLHAIDRSGVYSMEPEISERSLSHWLTVHAAGASVKDEDVPAGHRVEAHWGDIADAFLATIPERIRFWSRIRRDLLVEWDGERNGTVEIARYLERLRWIHTVSIDEDFNDLNGQRLSVIATALRFGSEAAKRVWHARDLSDDELQDWLQAVDDLIFMVEHDRGEAVEFRLEQALA